MTTQKLDLMPFCLRARAFLAQGRTEDAMGLFNDVIAVDPDNMQGYADRGTAWAMQKQFDLALADLDRAFALGYDEASAYSTAGTICLEQAEYDKALGYFSRAAQLDPQYPYTYYNRANVHYAMGNRAAAVADLETCLHFPGAADFRELVLQRLATVRSA
ncbi:tetratricopeptide repeat protein [Massilia sp. P8910]|uniref:tetratricopeptide repeat protein n=1 Tax=Massilia antarctica TaxID=2765360 RepID=UPI001E630781|nr:tetratricopeptide repeat protein [Massilia antarctica]MCE3602668.1 tetratricopeptide repeat protein [Massilia antarctica]